jgi:hypothetical protein
LEIPVPIVLRGQIIFHVRQSYPTAKLTSQLLSPILSGTPIFRLEKLPPVLL